MGARGCQAADMIKFLLAFCQSGNAQTAPVHNDYLLRHVFQKAKEVASQEEFILRTNLDKL